MNTQLLRNETKAAILNCGINKEVAKASKETNLYFDGEGFAYTPLERLKVIYGDFIVELALRLNQARYKRKQRVSDRVGSYITQGVCVFLTLTFRDDVLAATSQKTRRVYVSRFLKKNCSAYVANIDFGTKNQREHYHALVVGDNVNYSEWHKFGAIDGEKVRNSVNDLERTCKYVAKLSNHAMKMDGTCPRLIYSRKSPAVE